MMDEADWAAVLARVNAEHGSLYRLGRPLAGGRQGGAWTLQTSGEPGAPERVLTWTRNTRLAARRGETAELVAALVDEGYPTPTWREWGTFDGEIAWAVTDFAPGGPATWGTVPAALLIGAVEQQAGLARPTSETWNDYLRWALASADGPRREVADLGSAGAAFLAEVDRCGAALGEVELPACDAVHGDLELGNCLLDVSDPVQPRLAIIDTGACGPGTRAIDYAWLYRDAVRHAAPGVTADALESAGRSVAGDEVWAICRAFACLDVVAFIAREGSAQSARTEIGRLHRVLGASA